MLNSCVVNRKSTELTNTHLQLFWCASGTMTSGIKVSHIPVHSLVCRVLSLQYDICILQAMNPLEGWQRGWESVHSLAGYSFLYRQADLDKAQAKRRCRLIWYTLAANFASGMGACAGIVEPFKHLFRVTAHPQILNFFFWYKTTKRLCTCSVYKQTSTNNQIRWAITTSEEWYTNPYMDLTKLFHSRNSVSTEILDSTHEQSHLSWSMFVIIRYQMYRTSLIRHCGYYFRYCCSILKAAYISLESSYTSMVTE